MSAKLPLEMLYHWERTAPERVYLKQPRDGQWRSYTWKETADQARRIASAIKAKDFPPGSHIAIASKNCAQWIIADLAIWMAGHVSVPLYPNLSTSAIKAILEHSEAKLVFIGKLDDPQIYLDGVPAGLPAVSFGYPVPAKLPTWEEWTAAHAPMKENPTRKEEELATIIYTSGTTGTPKGVMHRFQSFSRSATAVLSEIEIDYNARFFSYLPLAHVAERLLTETVTLYAGSEVSFAESIDSFAENLQECSPTVFLGVPRIWEKFQVGILKKMPQKKLDLFLKIPILSSIVRGKIRKGLGLSKAKLCITGAAPISPALLEWFRNVGVEILEAYGLTENFAFSHFSRPGRAKFGYVGEPWPTVTTSLSEAEEILIDCPALMVGYFKDPQQSEAMWDKGRLKTGDLGEIDSQNRLKITGRVKDLFKTSKGKYVAPSPIELKVQEWPWVEQVCVVGTGLPQPIALVNLSEAGQSEPESKLKEHLQKSLDGLNSQLNPHERVRKIVIVDEAWTVDNEFLTPTMKLKRNKVEAKYQDKFTPWNDNPETILKSK